MTTTFELICKECNLPFLAINVKREMCPDCRKKQEIARRPFKPQSHYRENQQKESEERFKKIVVLRSEGKSLKELGGMFNVSAERIRQILNQGGVPTPQFYKNQPKEPNHICKRCAKPFFSYYPQTHCSMACRKFTPEEKKEKARVVARAWYATHKKQIRAKLRARLANEPQYKKRQLRYHREYQRRRAALLRTKNNV